MSDAKPVERFLGALRDLVAWLQSQPAAGIVIGGVAASLIGRPRVTRDVDVVVMLEEDRWDGFLALGADFGFTPRRPDCLAFARKTRVLLVRHGPSGIDVDVVFGALPFEQEAVDRATWVDAAGVLVPVPTPEDLVVMKALAHRPRDLADIEGILDTHPKLDRRRIRRLTRAISEALDMPDILSDLERLLARRRKRGK